MKELSLEKMEETQGGNRGCRTAYLGLAVAFASSFAGPAGIVSGAAGFLTFVNNIDQC